MLAQRWASHFCPGGKKFKAATLGGWGLAANNFNLSRGNECRKSTSAKSLRALANLSTQEYFFSRFQRYPTFNSTFMTNICKAENGTYDTSQIACLLTQIQSSDENRIRKISYSAPCFETLPQKVQNNIRVCFYFSCPANKKTRSYWGRRICFVNNAERI